MKAGRPHAATFGGKYMNVSPTKYVHREKLNISNVIGDKLYVGISYKIK
jgi:hypothetical protein